MKQTEKKPTKPNKKNRSIPLKLKLTGYFLLFSALLLIFLWLFQVVFLDDFYRFIKKREIEKTTNLICENIEDESLPDLVADIRKKDGVTAGVYLTTQRVFKQLYVQRDSGDFSMEIMPHEVYGYYTLAKEEGGELISTSDLLYETYASKYSYSEYGRGKNSRGDSDAELICARIFKASGEEYMVLTKARIAPVESTVQTLRIQLAILTAVFVMVSLVIAIYAAHKISKPLVKTNEQAKRLARQDYEVTFDAGGCREMCELSETLNFACSELATVDRLRRELIANASHDLRTPLTMIGGYAEVIRDIPGENTPENLQVIIDETQRLSSLVTDLLDLSKLESGATPLSLGEYNLTQGVREILTRYSRLTSQDGYVINFREDRDVLVTADETRLSQAVYNLINNAINYCGEDKTIEVTQIVENNRVRLEFTDHGKGIEPENLKFIWDRYYRVDKEHHSPVVGSGLGLSIVKNVLLRHGARFGVISTPGEGSTFWFELPCTLVDSNERTENNTSTLPDARDTKDI